MSSLEFVDVAGYRAIIFRRTRPTLQELIDQSHLWLEDKADWNELKLRWTFPSGARLAFGHMQYRNDVFKYKGPAFQFIGFDELTEFLEFQYRYLFSRLRRPKCQQHQDEPEPACPICLNIGRLAGVPLRMRCASNPDGIGRQWVRARFVSDEAADEISAKTYRDIYFKEHAGRQIPFVPALVEDNPGLDVETYVRDSLAELPPVQRAQIRHGDWKVAEAGLIHEDWLSHHYKLRGELLVPLKADGTEIHSYNPVDHFRFATLDTAGGGKQIVEEKRKGKESWTVCGIWDMVDVGGQRPWLFLRHVWRERVHYGGIKENIRRLHREWSFGMLRIENAHLGPAVYSDLESEGVPCELASTATANKKGETGKPAKVERATDFLNKLERGEIWLPDANADWLPAVETEWLGWTGDPAEPDDTIDVGSHAAIYSDQERTSGGTIAPFSLNMRGW